MSSKTLQKSPIRSDTGLAAGLQYALVLKKPEFVTRMPFR